MSAPSLINLPVQISIGVLHDLVNHVFIVTLSETVKDIPWEQFQSCWWFHLDVLNFVPREVKTSTYAEISLGVSIGMSNGPENMLAISCAYDHDRTLP